MALIYFTNEFGSIWRNFSVFISVYEFSGKRLIFASGDETETFNKYI